MRGDGRDEEPITVYLPSELPILTTQASRILLGMLVEMAEAEAAGEPRERGRHDC
jgi:hypothetical protein